MLGAAEKEGHVPGPPEHVTSLLRPLRSGEIPGRGPLIVANVVSQRDGASRAGGCQQREALRAVNKTTLSIVALCLQWHRGSS